MYACRVRDVLQVAVYRKYSVEDVRIKKQSSRPQSAPLLTFGACARRSSAEALLGRPDRMDAGSHERALVSLFMDIKCEQCELPARHPLSAFAKPPRRPYATTPAPGRA
jgi:hypothetical protein